eukprot:13385671-Alexandrium_andersonii.AAC.1
MSASLVGSEMCIRDSFEQFPARLLQGGYCPPGPPNKRLRHAPEAFVGGCLLYTSDAADDM